MTEAKATPKVTVEILITRADGTEYRVDPDSVTYTPLPKNVNSVVTSETEG